MTRASIRLGGGGKEVHVYKSVHRHFRKLNPPVRNINESMKLKIRVCKKDERLELRVCKWRRQSMSPKH